MSLVRIAIRIDTCYIGSSTYDFSMGSFGWYANARTGRKCWRAQLE